MPMRHAQRKHILHSLTSLLYQLHTVSFLLSPRLWPFICRISTQFQFSRPREIDSQRSLRFWFILIILVNLQCFYNHVFKGASEGRSIILDFVGVAIKPSKATLLSIDIIIVILEFILTTIAYETSFSLAMPPETPDPLQPERIPTTSMSPLPLDSEDADKSFLPTSSDNGLEYVVDVRLQSLLQRLRHPPPPPPPQQSSANEELLPLPNTTTFQLTRSLNMLVRARAQMRERAARTPRPPGAVEPQRRERQAGEPQESRRVPGSMGGEDEP